MMSSPSPGAAPWKDALSQEAHDLASAVAGGAIIGVPLLFTMEIWWHGADLSPSHLLGLLGAILVLNWGFDLISGFREKYSPVEALSEAVTAVAVGVVFAAIVLGLIGELSSDLSLLERVSKVLIAALAVSVGASFANSQVRKQSRTRDESEEESDGEDGKQGEEPEPEKDGGEREAAQWKADWKDIGATLAGSTVFALNVAPTEEILLIAARLTPLQQLGLLAFELVLGYVIVFASGFSEGGDFTGSFAQTPLGETLLATALSLGVAAALVFLLGQRSAVDSAPLFLAATLALGLPAVVGGAAGRIIA